MINDQLNAGQVDDVITDLTPDRDRLEAVATCICYYETNKDRMVYDLCGKRGLPVGPDVVKALASKSSAADSTELGAIGRRREPTPCPPSNAASRTTVAPTSSVGGTAALQPLE